MRLCNLEDDRDYFTGTGREIELCRYGSTVLTLSDVVSSPRTTVGFVRQFRFLSQRESLPHYGKKLAHLSQVLLDVGNNKLEDKTGHSTISI